MVGESGGGSMCEVVRADTTDLTAFVEAGAGHTSSLRAVFDAVSATRSRTMAALAVGEVPPARVARLDGGWDPLAEQIAEATVANVFVDEIRNALDRGDHAGAVGWAPADEIDQTVRWAPADEIDRVLTAAGLAGLGADRTMADDVDLAAELIVRRELAEALAGLDEDIADHNRVAMVGLAVEEWLTDQVGADPERGEAVARVLVDVGVEMRAGLTGDQINGPEGAVAGMLVTQGIPAWPGDRGELVDSLHSTVVSTGDGRSVTALSVAVDALDLDQTVDELNIYGTGSPEWRRANQPWVRNAALIMLIDASIDDRPIDDDSESGSDGRGTISIAGGHLVDDVLDRYPEVVELVDDTWHDTAFGEGLSDRYQSTPDGRACRVWPTEGIRATLARGLVAPNNGLSAAEYEAALTLDQLDAQLLAAVDGGDSSLDELWGRRLVLIDELVDGDPDQAQLLDRVMAQGLSAAEALRLLGNASDPGRTDDRVRRIRVLYPTTAWGDPVDPATLGPSTGSGAEPGLGLPGDVARSLAGELGVLQTVQLARFGEGRPVPDSPLTPNQVDLLRRYAEVAPWFHARLAGAYPGGAEPAVDMLAGMEADEFDRILFDAPDGFADLVAEMARNTNQNLWDLMAGADGNDTFLGPDGTYRPAGGNHVGLGDARALLVQLALQSAIGRHQGDLDLDGNGIIHEDEVADWLEMAAAGGPGLGPGPGPGPGQQVPPALVDRIRLGTSHGLGQDTVGWEEIGEVAGWVGLAAAVTATTVYSGGAATPLWVKAGLAGLAVVEAYAYTQADDPGGGLEPLDEVGARTMRRTTEERAEIVQSRPWRSFDRDLDDQFLARLDEFGGDPHPPGWLRGGEGQLFLSEEYPDLTLKRWHEARSGDFDESVQALTDARAAVSSDSRTCYVHGCRGSTRAGTGLDHP